MEMKQVVGILVLLAASLQSSVATPDADPVRQLRVPRIYNALITSNEKLQPSRAYPHSAPVLQPLGPGFGPPLAVGPPVDVSAPNGPVPEGKSGPEDKQMQYPLTFYPRQLGYYPQPYYHPYQYQSPYPYAGVYPGAYPYRATPLVYASPPLQEFKAEGTFQMKFANKGRSDEGDDSTEEDDYEEDASTDAAPAPAPAQ